MEMRILAIFVLSTIVLTSFASAQPEYPAEIFFMGEKVENDVTPYYDLNVGMIMIPVRFIMETAGYIVTYDEETETVTAVSVESGQYIALQIGNRNVFGNTDGLMVMKLESWQL